MKHWFLACLAGVAALPAVAQQLSPTDGLKVLERIAAAAQQLNYSGVFVYQSGNRTETSRITHLGDGVQEFERLEALDGSPREIVRHNDEVRCYMPESRLLIVERRSGQRSFPALLPGRLSGLSEHYMVRRAGTGRVAGLDSQSIVVEPKDDNRYGHQLWIDARTGLLLKASMLNEKGEPIETFMFTELKIGKQGAIPPVAPPPDSSWRMHVLRSAEARRDDGQWLFRNSIPGFRRQPDIKRQLHPDGGEATHVMFSDGLAAVSVFIEPVAGQDAGAAGTEGPVSIGAINVLKRRIGGYRLVVVGDVPADVLKQFTDGIEPRSR